MLCKLAEYSILSENDLLNPVTPSDPRLTFDHITSVEGLELMHIYESYGHAMKHGRVITVLVKMTFLPL